MLRRSEAVRLFVLCVFAAPALFAQGIISTLAGTDWVFPANNKPARSAPLGRIAGVAIDRAGNLLIADPDNGQVFKVDPNGVLTIFAGNGFRGYSGDSGPATAASLDGPNSIAVDQAGNVYIADSADNRIRKVSPTGIISTIAGTGAYADTGDGGLAVQAAFSNPTAVAVDRDGSVYVADLGGGRIRKIDVNGKINAVAGATKLDSPTDLALDSAGGLYIAESGTRLVRKLEPAGVLRTIAGSGEYLPPQSGVSATKSALRGPLRIALDANGLLYISDEGNYIVQKVDAAGVITTVAGTGTVSFSGDGGAALKAAFNSPTGIAVDSAGNLFVCDSFNLRLRRVNTAGIIDTVAGNAAYRFGGDGGPAIAALFNLPTDVKLDAAGNLYIVDTLGNRIRKVTTKGVISTFAGTGERGYSGDGGPAANARLYEPTAIALDSTGNLYVTDTGNHVIRRIRADGTISTFAGTGVQGYNGEGVPASQAQLSFPGGIAIDSKGSIFFADGGNFRVRKIDTAGVVTTVAGTGQAAQNDNPVGDGGPATKALLSYLDGVAVDGAGNVYVSEKYANRVRKIDAAGKITIYAGLLDAPALGDGGPATKAAVGPRGLTVDAAGNLLIADEGLSRIRKVSAATGIITTIAGSATSGYAGDGGSAVLAQLNRPTGVAVDSAGNLYIADTQNRRIRSVTNLQPPFSVSADSLTFSAQSGGALALDQQLLVTSTIVNTVFTAASSEDWLTVTPTTGLMPGGIRVVADPSNLSVGTYDARITITAPTSTPPARVVAVRFNVTPAPDPKLATEPDLLDFTRVQGGGAETQTFRVLNNGSGTLDITVTFAPTSGGSWLQVSPASGSVSATVPLRISATASPAGLAAGTYAGLVTIAAPKVNQRVLVPVAMTVNSNTQNMVLSQTGLTFTVVSGGSAPPGQPIGVLNTGLGTMNWTATANTISGGNWLAVSPAGGASGAVGTNIGYVQVDVNPAGLTAGEYYGRITVAANTPNSPQTASVVLRILPPGTATPPDVRPTGFIFVAPPDRASPPTQSTVITNLGTTPLTFVSSSVTNPVSSGGGGRAPIRTTDANPVFNYQPVTGTVAPGEPARVVIQARPADQPPGIQRGTITFQFSDGSVRPVDVLLAIPSTTPTAAARAPMPAAGNCTPRSLSLVFTLLGQQFVVPAAWPSPVEVRVVDDCGDFLNSGSVTLSFSNLDAPVTMVSIGDGRWSGTWQPRGNAPQVRITATAETTDRTIRGTAQITGGVSANAAVPVLPPGSVVNAASFAAGAPIAPGSLISIFGSRLADSPNATVPPLPIRLGSTLVDLSGVALPLYYVSDQQINAIVPYTLPVNTRLGLIVQRGTQLTVPQFVTIAPAQPAVFTADATGTGQGDIFDINNLLVDRNHPARRGDTVVIYCAGLGPVDQPVSVTQPVPDSPLSNTVNPVTVTIGGQRAFTAFAGLTPRYTGLYQVNAVIPDGVPPGDSVEVTISVAGQTSPPVTMAIR